MRRPTDSERREGPADLTRYQHCVGTIARAADRLTYFNRHVGPNALSQAQGVFEEYRYDALGRRVFVRSRRPSTCSSPCEAYVQRTVWDGEQVLYEIRSSGNAGVNPTHMELEGGAQTGETIDLYGIVAYTLGLTVDEPVGVLKQYADGDSQAHSVRGSMTPEQNYLHDVFATLLDRGRQARSAALSEQALDANSGFESGRVQGYYEVLSTMLHQLDAFGIQRRGVGVPDDLDLERELL